MVGCSLGHARLWFTLGFGIVNEVYYPRVDIPQIRNLGFIEIRSRPPLGIAKAAPLKHKSAAFR
jgi:GH15 family glucan-1,4-alpha-glucosidase